MLTKAKIISIFILGVLVFYFSFLIKHGTWLDWFTKYVSPSTVVLILDTRGIEGFQTNRNVNNRERFYEILDIGDGPMT
jgi:hypothetical protein